MTQPRIIIIAGPNGAGKTTFAREFLPQEADCPAFINADLIASGLSPFAPERAAMKAGRLMLEEIARHVARIERFAFETTLFGKAYAQQIPHWRRFGFRVELFFLSRPSADSAVQSVCGKAGMTFQKLPSADASKQANDCSSISISPWWINGPVVTTRAMSPD